MSAVQLGPPEFAATLSNVGYSKVGEGGLGSSALFPKLEQTRFRGYREHKRRDKNHPLRCFAACKAHWGGCRRVGHSGVPLQLQVGPRSGVRASVRVQASAGESSDPRNRSEDELTLAERLNAISHRRTIPGVNGASAPSMGFGAAAAAQPNDPSLPPRLRGRSFPDPVQPPPVVRASNRPDVVGVLGGISPRATADFMRQLIQATPANSNQDHIPLVVCSLPQIPSLSAPILNRPIGPGADQGVVSPLPALLDTRRFLEQAGARAIVMPSNMAHFWYDQLALDCSVPFLHIADAVAEELDLANLEPLEAGSQPKVGLLASEATLKAGIYQQKLEAKGYTVVLPDPDTMAHAVLPGMEAVERGDNEGAKNLLGIGVQVLLVNAVNVVILAFSEASSVFPPSDPILKRCLSPTAALARATVRWALKARADATPDA